MDRPHHWPPHSRCEVDRRYIILEKVCFDCTPVVASDGPLDWATRNAIQHTHTHAAVAPAAARCLMNWVYGAWIAMRENVKVITDLATMLT